MALGTRSDSIRKMEASVAKADWGIKRTCQGCAVRFYDLRKAPIVCPKCGHRHDAEDFVKSRRSRPSASKAPVVVAVPKKPVPAPAEAIDDVEIADTEADALIEDTDDLEDGDDIPEVAAEGEEPAR